MKIRPSIRVFFILTFALLAVVVFWSNNGDKEPETSPEESTSKPRYHKKETSIQLSEKFTWDSVTKRELEEFNEFFGGKTSPHSFESKISVLPGDTVITDFYEGLPGEFVFSEVTPEITIGEDGLPIIEVFTDTKRLLLDGSIETISAQPVEAPAGGLSWSIGTDSGIYRLLLIGNHDDTTGMISLDLEGKFIPKPNKNQQPNPQTRRG